MLPPAAFLLPLKNAQLLVKATRYILACAASQLHSVLEPEYGAFFISFNTSLAHLQGGTLPKDCREFLATVGNAELNLMVEMPERGADLSIADCSMVFEQLERAGVTVALDDFGVGDARLHQFASGQIACVKIDQSFVREIESNLLYRRLIAKMVDFSGEFGAYVTAEGVESSIQYRWLRRLGVKLFQGYLFDRPLPASTFFDRLPLMTLPRLV
ncbi:EAL domain-containing protein [Herbaspirillum frisingense]|uniref:EAL domain-containing protein n=1 Tax=Herbaspirillum frisingense TaxID=92645 RepID=UPI001F31E8CE|nr:EAL domain-containing protein [Herbaspirillum frisingense]